MVDNKAEFILEMFNNCDTDITGNVVAILINKLAYEDGFIEHLVSNTELEVDKMLMNEIVAVTNGTALTDTISNNIPTIAYALYSLSQEDTEELMEHAYSSERCKMNIIKMLTKNY